MDRLNDYQITEKLAALNGWKLNDLEGRAGLLKVFPTRDFLTGLGFVVRIAVLAEKANHHPDITLTYPKVSVRLSTHDAGGLTTRDFDLAAQIDLLFGWQVCEPANRVFTIPITASPRPTVSRIRISTKSSERIRCCSAPRCPIRAAHAGPETIEISTVDVVVAVQVGRGAA